MRHDYQLTGDLRKGNLMLVQIHRVVAALTGPATRTDDEGGQALVEYALIMALIVLVAAGALKLLGTNIGNLLSPLPNDI
jgi:Flp pilus assembly pilin Flp